MGNVSTVMGYIDLDFTLTCQTKNQQFTLQNVLQATYCKSMNSIIVMTLEYAVKRYNLQGELMDVLCDASPAHGVKGCLDGSDSHVLFHVDTLYGIGSNRMIQLGCDMSIDSFFETPIEIDFLTGLPGVIGNVACGTFHSVVEHAGELYTFGWAKDGRLGRGHEDNEGHIGVALFKKEGDNDCDPTIVKVVCGSGHTLALDDEGTVWTCGDSKVYVIWKGILCTYKINHRQIQSIR